MRSSTKRWLALVVLLGSAGVLAKLGKMPTAQSPSAAPPNTVSQPAPAPINERQKLLDKYPEQHDLVQRVWDRYRHTAVAVDNTDGLRGLKLLDAYDLEAVYLYEQAPSDFRKLRDLFDDRAAAELLIHWREYIGGTRADEATRAVLLAEIGRLTPTERRWVSRVPSSLPYMLVDSGSTTELLAETKDDPELRAKLFTILAFVGLDSGTSPLRAAIRTMLNHSRLAADAFDAMGPEGFALVHLEADLLAELETTMPLADAMALVRVNLDDIETLRKTRGDSTVAGLLAHAWVQGLADEVGGSAHGLRLIAEHGILGERALRKAGADAATLVYQDFRDEDLRRQAVSSLAEHGTSALVVLARYSISSDFREILRTYGAEVVPPIAASDLGPEAVAALGSSPRESWTEKAAYGLAVLAGESGQKTIATIRRDGMERVRQIQSTDLKAYQFLPLYDLIHLGNVVRHGYAPTAGEASWAVVDGCLVLVDALSLVTLQPEGIAASELARSELKGLAKQAAKGIGRELSEQGAEAAGRAGRKLPAQLSEQGLEAASKHWAVRAAGGTYTVLRRYPEAIQKMRLDTATQLARPLWEKAGLALTRWPSVRITRNGQEMLVRVPLEKGVKYLAVECAAAGVGLVAVQKMEEHLSQRLAAPR